MAEDETKAAENPAEQAPKKKSKLPLLLSVLVLVAGGGAAA